MATASKASRLFDLVDQKEFAFCQAINRSLRFRPLRGYFQLVSKLGDGWIWYALILSLPWILPAQGPGLAMLMALTGLCCSVIYKGLKRWLVRERPFISFPSINCGTPPLDRYSFPSGHTLHAVCFTVMLAAGSPTLALYLAPFTLSVAASRVFLGLHYPTDVLAGAVIGSMIGGASVYWLGDHIPAWFSL